MKKTLKQRNKNKQKPMLVKKMVLQKKKKDSVEKTSEHHSPQKT